MSSWMCSAGTRLTSCLYINHKIMSSISCLRQNQSTALCISWPLISLKCLRNDWMRIFRKDLYVSAHSSSVFWWSLSANLRKVFRYVWIIRNLITSSSKINTLFLNCKRFSIVWPVSDSSLNLTSFQLFINSAIKKKMNEKLFSALDMNCLNLWLCSLNYVTVLHHFSSLLIKSFMIFWMCSALLIWMTF